MSELIKRLITAMTLCLTALLVHAQEWTKEDSSVSYTHLRAHET